VERALDKMTFETIEYIRDAVPFPRVINRAYP